MHQLALVPVALGWPFVGVSGCGVMKGSLASVGTGRGMICVAGRL
ncbi:hypothetical protein [Pseudomonas syringae]|nr:hypothetical protein [Pseudomonas syringae]